MLISLVTGSYNRLHLLQSMLSSVRSQMYKGIEYEIIVVDGGSTDGTIDWCKSQADIHLIEHGELRGAIPAFCDGARAATGEYVIMANDDIVFKQDSIIAALSHLETVPLCGAVAFADDRYNPRHMVQGHTSRDSNNKQITSHYAQVGMYRRWLGDLAGWWGDQDEILKNSRTYGGDNYLSSRIWEMGYTIDPVRLAICDDGIARDNMRVINEQSAEDDARRYYSRYPYGAKFGEYPPIDPQQTPNRLRVLYLPLYEGDHVEQHKQKQGLRNALKKLGIVAEYDYIVRGLKNNNIGNEIIQLARALKPDILFTQLHGGEHITPLIMSQLRGEHPSMMCIDWNGDVWEDVYLRQDTINTLQWFDLALVVNTNVIPPYQAQGIKAVYWQVASEEPERFDDVYEHDIVFLANAYSEERKALGEYLKSLPYNVGLYGSGWEELGDGYTLYDFKLSHALMRKAKIVIGDNQYPDEDGFVSNRFFETLFAGGFLLHQPVKGLRKLTGIKANSHYIEWTDLDDLGSQIFHYMDDSYNRNKIAKRGQRYVKAHHTFDRRVHDLFTSIIPERLG